MISIIALIIGILLVVAGVYYLATDKSGGDSKKIYAITLVCGVLIAAFAAFTLLK